MLQELMSPKQVPVQPPPDRSNNLPERSGEALDLMEMLSCAQDSAIVSTQLSSPPLSGNVQSDNSARSRDAPSDSRRTKIIEAQKRISTGKRSFDLEHTWTFWIIDPEKHWEESIERICDFSTVDGFWRVFNYLEPPSTYHHLGYSLFKLGVRPEWEDPANSRGGRWALTGSFDYRQLTDRAWLELCMLCIGGSDLGRHSPWINGIYISWRGHTPRLSVWLKTTERDVALPIGHIIQGVLFDHLGYKFAMEFTELKSKKKQCLYSLSDRHTF